jgi:hypothetical protein
MVAYECKLPCLPPDSSYIFSSRGYFSQHHVDTLNPEMSPVQFLASKFPGKTEQEYRGHLGNFQISGMTGWVSLISCTISVGWDSVRSSVRQAAVDRHAVWRSEVTCGVCCAFVDEPAHFVARRTYEPSRYRGPSLTLASLRRGKARETYGRTQGLDALMAALNSWNGGVIIISHDERFITNVAKEVNTFSSTRMNTMC